MFSPLFASIIERHDYAVCDEGAVAACAAREEFSVLFLAGDADRLMESNDVAVIFPELIKAFGGRLTPIVVARESERVLQRKYRFSAFPALVFLKRGEYLGAISRVRDWADYIEEISEILGREPSEPPPFKLPGQQKGAVDAHHHEHHEHE
ncbi:MAG: hydrogenase-1 expression HyaE [Hyphomicrobiaceae bacterium]|nr:hydrogenase-1 expression HyaE [Hyphomicrobiaceae bacterium]